LGLLCRGGMVKCMGVILCVSEGCNGWFIDCEFVGRVLPKYLGGFREGPSRLIASNNLWSIPSNKSWWHALCGGKVQRERA
jgi:hypothetical protein